MKKSISLFFLFFSSIPVFAQSSGVLAPLNLDFEKTEKGTATGWYNFGGEDYKLALDSANTISGQYSATIEFKGGSTGFNSWAYTLPDNYPGKKITLSGFIRTENVTDGYAGLWMRIDPSIGFDNMSKSGIKGTTGWTKYEITLDMNPQKTKGIVVGGLLVGKGKMWLDNLSVSIDGKDIKNVKPLAKKLLPADRDTQFDKGSGISDFQAGKQQLENLKQLGLIWGFLKYHHPNIAKGNYNWDYELFRILPKILSSTDTKKRDELFVSWIQGLGDFKENNKKTNTSDDVIFKPDLDWISNSGFSTDLQSLLQKIKNAERENEHYYIGMEEGIGNPDFRNENLYPSMPYPDNGFRILALFRYWNMIHYFFPYKHLTDKNWNQVLPEYLPLFLNASTELEYEMAMLKLIAEVHDTHANLWGAADKIDQWKGKFYPPVHVRFIEEKLVVTDYYNPELQDRTGLAIGDVITKINSKSIEEMIEEKSPYFPASNKPTQLRNMSIDLLRSNSRTIEIAIIGKDEKERNITLNLYPRDSLNIYSWYKKSDSKSFKMLDNNIGYVTLQTIKEDDIQQIKKEFKDTKGIIIDIRNYPATFVPFSLGSYFTSMLKPFVKFSTGSIKNPGEFTINKVLKIPGFGKSYDGKLVVLVNEQTQSQAEYTAMAFRAGKNTTIIGSTTAGADGNVSSIPLPGGLKSMISGIGVYYPDGKETQRAGIIPDLEIKPSIKGIRENRDELMEKAIEIINQP